TTAFSFSSNIDNGKYKKTKTFTKEYIVDADNTVDIDNRYGDLTITTWNKNSVSILVTVTVECKSEERVDKKLDDINVDFKQTKTHVYAETTMNSKSTWSLFSFGSNTNISFSIDYEIKMPVSNNVNLENDYGSIYIDNLEGECNIDCDYGGIQIGKLLNKHNFINMDYGKQSNIDYINKAEINSDYSKISIENANNLAINADYSHFEMNNINKILYNCDYGSIKVENVQDIKGNGDYFTLKIHELNKSLEIDNDYGSIKIYQLNKSFENVVIEADYTSVKVGIQEETSLNFDVSTSYAGIDFNDLDVDYSYKEDKMSKKIYKGNINRDNTNSSLHINSSYGGIKLYRSQK
ncbi:MAG: hypothetical protein ABFS35_22455, partial [Bacteroidota bacterium]